MESVPVLAVLLLALGAFPIVVVGRYRPDDGPGSEPELIRGFAYVGGFTAVVLAAAVIVVAVVGPGGGRAGNLAILGLFGLALYHVAGLAVWRLRLRRH